MISDTRFDRARAETVFYHEQYYAKHRLFAEGSWLEGPDPKVSELGLRFAEVTACRVLDLGAGVGRNSIPLAKMLKDDALISCVELLPSAAQMMGQYAREHNVEKNLEVLAEDFEKLPLAAERFHLVLAISTLEHCSSHKNLVALVKRLQAATAVDGLHYFSFSTSRQVKDAESGEAVETFVETPLQTEAWLAELADLYRGWDIEILRSMPPYSEVLTYKGRQVVWSSDEMELQARKIRI